MDKIKIYPVLLLKKWDPVLTANGSALPIGTIVAYAKSHKAGALKDNFEFVQLVNRYPDEWSYYIEEAKNNPAAIWLFSSYMWNHKNNMEIAQKIKEVSPHSLIIAGGPHIPAYEEENRLFLKNHPYIDITARGEGEVTLAEILETVASHETLHPDFSQVAGITFRNGDSLVRTIDRVRTKNLDIFPSPYLTGEFDHPSFDDLPLMILETNRGCPFGCTFCDWGAATLQKFSLFDFDRIKKEVELIVKKRPYTIYLGDSNFGAFDRDLELVTLIAEQKRKYGYPKEFGTSLAKNASGRLASIIKVLGAEKLATYGLISIQTTDEETLAAINRSNIRNEKYEKLIEIFRKEKLNLSSELLIGLPGQTIASHKEDLQFFIDRKLMTIAYCTAVMPNAPMNEPGYRKKYQIVTNDDDYIISTSTFTDAERSQMIKIFLGFQFFYGLGVLRYYLYYLQMEHSIRFMDFVERYLEITGQDPITYPLSCKLQNTLLVMKRDWSPSLEWTSSEGGFFFNNIGLFYKEVVLFTSRHYHLVLEPSVQETLLSAQEAVMPAVGKSVPFEVHLLHDLPAYIQQIKDINVLSSDRPDAFRPLLSFPSATLKVSALRPKVIDNVALAKFDRHTGAGFELKSLLRFHH